MNRKKNYNDSNHNNKTARLFNPFPTEFRVQLSEKHFSSEMKMKIYQTFDFFVLTKKQRKNKNLSKRKRKVVCCSGEMKKILRTKVSHTRTHTHMDD